MCCWGMLYVCRVSSSILALRQYVGLLAVHFNLLYLCEGFAPLNYCL
jgi:hypothetical protein